MYIFKKLEGLIRGLNLLLQMNKTVSLFAAFHHSVFRGALGSLLRVAAILYLLILLRLNEPRREIKEVHHGHISEQNSKERVKSGVGIKMMKSGVSIKSCVAAIYSNHLGEAILIDSNDI